MAAQDYYHNAGQQYQPYNQPQSTFYSQAEHGLPQIQSRPSMAPSYHSNDPLDHRQSPPAHSKLHSPNTYSENIPLKDRTRIQTNQSEWPPAQNTAYPPSPESHNPEPGLLPTSDRKKRRKKKKGFFAGKVPWFVYFISLVQITVFIVEIIKNCKLESSGAMLKLMVEKL